MHHKIFNSITPTRSPLPYTMIHEQIPEIRMWRWLGDRDSADYSQVFFHQNALTTINNNNIGDFRKFTTNGIKKSVC